MIKIKKLEDKLTDLEGLFLDNLFSDEYLDDAPAAAIAAGYSENTSSSQLKYKLTEHIVERTERYLANQGLKSAKNLVSIQDKPAQAGAANIINSANSVLDRIGIVKKQKMELETNQQTAILILPSKNTDED